MMRYKAVFELFQKVHLHPVHDIINYSTFISHFKSGKCGKEGKNYKNLNISRTKRAFCMK